MVRLAVREVRNALEIVHAVSATASSEPFPPPTIELLRKAIPAEVVTYSEWDISSGTPRLTAATPDPAITAPPDIADARREHCGSYPLSGVARSAERTPLKISDFLTLRQLRRSTYYDGVLRPLEIEHELRVWLTAPPGTTRFFAFARHRGRRDFGERDRALLELLRPFLVATRDRHRPAECANRVSVLTEREAEILRWVARGKTNQEIAALLVVSPHTVRTHLEHIFDKLGVHSRAAAIASAFALAN